jgi:hypothetical protein
MDGMRVYQDLSQVSRHEQFSERRLRAICRVIAWFLFSEGVSDVFPSKG